MNPPTLCGNCGSTCGAGSKFCADCGAPLARSCPACASAVDPGARFCPECGTRLAAASADAGPLAPSAIDTESVPVADRRFVSVLFADLVAYTTFTEGRDPEEVRELLTVYYDRSRSIIEKFGGVVEKFIGDAIFGVWGSRTVREDDAERAVRAGLEMVSMMSSLGHDLGHDGLQLRAGVMSGATSVGTGGNESTGMIVGDLVNTAARLQSVADPDTVFVGRATHDVTARSIAYESKGELAVKGKADTVEAWRALRPMGRLGADANIRELPFVGREREMRLLTDWLDATTADGRARLVSVTGEAGIGKSRLAKEFLHHVDGYADDVYWHQGRSPSYGDGVPMWSLIEMVRQRAGILEDEDPSRARTRLRTMLAEYVGDPAERQWIESWLAGLISVGTLPTGSRSELLSALRTLFQHIAQRGTTVLVFEDVHWADDSVVEFITELVDHSTRSPILVIALARPEMLDRHPTFGSQRASVHIGLGALSDDDVRDAVSEYLGCRHDDLVDWIVGRAAGYPLYAAEILRMLLNDGSLVELDGRHEWRGDLDQLVIPETLQAVIGARLDRLDPGVLDLLQDAAVLGLTFHAGSLRAFSNRTQDDVDDALRTLVRLDILEVVDDLRSPERGQYRFVQGLIQELAYDRLNRVERRSRHLDAARHFGVEDDPEHAGVVAKHFMGAYDASPAGPERDELVQRATDSLINAAEASRALHADRVALDLYDRALDLAPRGAPRADWCIAASRCAAADGGKERALRYLARAEQALGSDPTSEELAALAVRRAWVYNSFFDSGEALRVIVPVYEALDVVDDDLSVRIAAEATRTFSLSRLEWEAVVAADRALPVAERLGATELTVHVLISRSTALSFGGRPIEGMAGLIGAYEIAVREGLLEPATRAANNLAAMLADVHTPTADEWNRRVADIARRSGVKEWVMRSLFVDAFCALFDGDLDAAIEHTDHIAEMSTDEGEQGMGRYARTAIDLRAGADGAMSRALALVDEDRESTDAQTVGMTRMSEAVIASLQCEWAGAFGHAIEAYGDARVALVALHAASRLGLTDEQFVALDHVVDGMGPGPIRTAQRELLDAAQRVVGGDREAGALAFGHALDLLDEASRREDLVWARATVVAILGSDHSVATREAELLRGWIVDHRLWGFVPMLAGLVEIDTDHSIRAAG